MQLEELFKSIIDQDKMPIVICDDKHKIVYLNDAADINYSKYGGREALLNKSILDCHNKQSQEKIIEVVNWFKESKDNNCVHTFYNPKQNKDVYMIALRDNNGSLIGYYEKHESRNIDTTPLYDLKKDN
ncbi:MAG: PAS domain-containing protein [Clostridia bacterium]|nr:PAS domain-containing protein [Clostridia bacterium]